MFAILKGIYKLNICFFTNIDDYHNVASSIVVSVENEGVYYNNDDTINQ